MKKTTKKVKKKKATHKMTISKDKQIEFARRYFASKKMNGEATQIYIDLGFSAKGAAGNASRMLTKPIVKKELARLAASQEERLNIKSDNILAELMKSALSDVRELFNDDGTMKDPKEWSEHIAKAVSSIQVDEIMKWDEKKRKHVLVGYTKKIKLWDKIKALELLGKHLKLFADNTININLSADIIDRMKQARQRTILDE